MRKVIITITLSMAVVAGTQLPVRAGTNFEGPNYHWESAYNHTDPYAQTLRAFAVHDRTNNPAFQANIRCQGTPRGAAPPRSVVGQIATLPQRPEAIRR